MRSERRRSKYYRRLHRQYLRTRGGRAYVKKWMRRYRKAMPYEEEYLVDSFATLKEKDEK